jgi:hypothetical protein
MKFLFFLVLALLLLGADARLSNKFQRTLQHEEMMDTDELEDTRPLLDKMRDGPIVRLPFSSKLSPDHFRFLAAQVEDTDRKAFAKTFIGDENTAFFVTQDGGKYSVDGLIQELGKDGGSFAGLMGNVKTKFADKKPFLTKTWEILSAQAYGDKPYFVSHSASHGIRVMKLADDYRKVFLQDGKAAFGGEAHGNGGYSDYATFEKAVLISNLIHDVGYAGLGSSDKKWVHAQAGKLMIEGFMKTEMDEIFTSDGTTKITAAIGAHNYDVNPAPSAESPAERDVKLISENGKDPIKIFSGSSITRTYTPATLHENPLLWLLRLADNLDAQYIRLTPHQQAGKFMKGLYDLYKAESDDAWKELKKTQDFKNAMHDVIDSSDGGWKFIGPLSFLHFVSNWAVKDSAFTVDGESATLTVNLYTKDNAPLKLKLIVAQPFCKI